MTSLMFRSDFFESEEGLEKKWRWFFEMSRLSWLRQNILFIIDWFYWNKFNKKGARIFNFFKRGSLKPAFWSSLLERSLLKSQRLEMRHHLVRNMNWWCKIKFFYLTWNCQLNSNFFQIIFFSHALIKMSFFVEFEKCWFN